MSSEMQQLQGYMRDQHVEEMFFELAEAVLQDKPSDPKSYLISVLTAQKGQGHSASAAAADHRRRSSIAEVPSHLLQKLFGSLRLISSEIAPKTTIRVIIDETINLLHCDRVSLFVLDKKSNMLLLSASNMDQVIRVAPGQGIAGAAFTTKVVINIPDCYADSRFDSTFDQKTGYRTSNLLCMPILDFDGESVGVIQAINKNPQAGTGKSAPVAFEHVDEVLLEHLAQQAAVALRNAEVYKEAIVASGRANALVHLLSSLTQDLGPQSVVHTITTHSSEVVQADRCTVFLVDEGADQLWSVSTDSGKEIRIPRTAGIAGECCTSQQVINIPDAYADSRFHQETDRASGYHTRSILAMPVFNETRSKVIAVVQLINKKEWDGELGAFDEEDIHLMQTLATLVGTKLSSSQLLRSSAKKSEAAKMVGGRPQQTQAPARSAGPSVGGIVEEDEDEED